MSDEKDELEVTTQFGSVKAGGSVVVIIIAIIVAAGLGLYMLREHDLKAAEMSNDTKKQISDLKEATNEQTFVLTLSEKERRDLRMDMPESLRRKVGR